MGKDDGEDGFYAVEAATNYAEIHFYGHDRVDEACNPCETLVSRICEICPNNAPEMQVLWTVEGVGLEVLDSHRIS